ncbi:MAG TPA: hypothetical protein VGI92_14080 [Gemmatimonadales bacterium]|jgi:hypothetical protein
MSRRALLLLVLLVLVAEPARLAAQASFDSTAYLRSRVAQLDSLLGHTSASPTTRSRVLAEQAHDHPLRVQVEGRLTLAVPLDVPAQWVSTMAHAADSTLGEFGGIPDETIRRLVLLEVTLTPENAMLAQFKGRPFASLSPVRASDSAEANGSKALEAMAHYFTGTLDSTWQKWLEGQLVLAWNSNLDGERALDDLASVGGYVSGKECLAGMLASCRQWLGLDDSPQPYSVRYRPQELVSALRNSDGSHGNPTEDRCRGGDAQACAEFFTLMSWHPLPSIPASGEMRMSLLRELRERHGKEALRRVLADSAGSVGDRLSHAAGISEDSLVSEWRLWVLGRGRIERVTAGPGDLVSALLFSAILVGMAIRSGRWR